MEVPSPRTAWVVHVWQKEGETAQSQSPPPLLPPFPLCHHLPNVSLVTGVLCHRTRL